MSGAMSCFKVIIEKKNHLEINIIKFQRGKYQIGACATISSTCILFWHFISCIYFPQRHQKSACPTRFYYVLSEYNILHTHISHWRIMAFLCVDVVFAVFYSVASSWNYGDFENAIWNLLLFFQTRHMYCLYMHACMLREQYTVPSFISSRHIGIELRVAGWIHTTA